MAQWRNTIRLGETFPAIVCLSKTIFVFGVTK